MSSEGIMRRARRWLFASVLALVIPAVFAQSPPAPNRDDLDVTMHVIVDPDAKVPDEIVRRIPLPKPAQPAPGASPGTTESGKPAKDEKPAPGANGQGREFGQQVSDEAKQRSEEARHNKPPKPEKPPKPDKPPGKPSAPPGRPPNPGG
jgi:hypothetical protein